MASTKSLPSEQGTPGQVIFRIFFAVSTGEVCLFLISEVSERLYFIYYLFVDALLNFYYFWSGNWKKSYLLWLTHKSQCNLFVCNRVFITLYTQTKHPVSVIIPNGKQPQIWLFLYNYSFSRLQQTRFFQLQLLYQAVERLSPPLCYFFLTTAITSALGGGAAALLSS